MNEQYRIFIGYDPREQEAFDVCSKSIARRASSPLRIERLGLDDLRSRNLYYREWRSEGNQRYDLVDGKPFSTDFSFSRFLVPRLCDYSGWALFVDCDFLFLEDVAELFAHRDEKYAVMVVKHDYSPTRGLKMDNQIQESYPRKNWSSLILWNCGHKANEILTPGVVNTQTGRWLHGFSWLENEQIGALPRTWNWLEGHSKPSAIHFTRGGPWFAEWQRVEYAPDWHEERLK